mmetsp:Transcript_87864/g.251746  ORF Transcript_87864/g.251746 Transcript_87864/m.251746 type:complete len:209 (+) Transcript_87864:1675-2301(+)
MLPSTSSGSEHQRSAHEAMDLRLKKSRAVDAGVAVTWTKPSSSVESLLTLLYSSDASSKQSTAACKPVARRTALLIIIRATFPAVSLTIVAVLRSCLLLSGEAMSLSSPWGTRQRRASCWTRGASKSWPYKAAMIKMLRKFPQVIRHKTVGQPRMGMRSRQKFNTRAETDVSDPATTSLTADSRSRPCIARSSSARSTAPGTPSLGMP